eukprot:scaffold6163_cov78-Cylindrotheca_fusiformis.AAC.3
MNENSEAESIIRTASGVQQDGRAPSALCDKYEGVGMLATNVIEAERTVENIFYSGERQPHMWWDRFERELREAYATLDMNAGRPVHDDETKLRKLVNHRVNADFLKGAKDVLLVEMGKPNAGGMTFDMAMATFWNAVNSEIARKPAGVSGRRGRAFKISQAQLSMSKKQGGGGGKKGRPNAKKRQAKVKKLNARISELETKLAESTNAPTGNDGQNVTVAEASVAEASRATPMGGRNERQQERQQQPSMAARIAALEAQYNARISAVHIRVKTAGMAISAVESAKESPPRTEAFNEDDTNAEVGVAGKNMIALAYTTRSADVLSYDSNQPPVKDVPIASCGTAYDDPITGNTYILVFHEFLIQFCILRKPLMGWHYLAARE